MIIPIILILLNCVKLFNSELQPFVVNGKPARIVDFPHSALITVFCDPKHTEVPWICGASIVREDILMTAAHCLLDCDSDNLIGVTAGHRHQIKSFDSSVSTFSLHEDFDQQSSANDIALMKIKTALTFGTKIKRVAFMDDPPYFEPAKVAGWGFIDVSN